VFFVGAGPFPGRGCFAAFWRHELGRGGAFSDGDRTGRESARRVGDGAALQANIAMDEIRMGASSLDRLKKVLADTGLLRSG